MILNNTALFNLTITILWKDHKQPYSQQCGEGVYIYSTADYLTLICHDNRCYVWHARVVLLGFQVSDTV